MRALRSSPLLLVVFAACSHGGAGQGAEGGNAVTRAFAERKPIAAEVAISELREGELDALRAELAKRPELEGLEVRGGGSTATLSFRYKGDPDDLASDLADVDAVGLRTTETKVSLKVTAFDARPPTIAFLHPQPETIWSKKELDATVDVPDKDVAEVTIDGKPASRVKGSVWRARIPVQDGERELKAVAKDKAGNAAEATVKLVVDTTAPAIQATLKLIVEGKVDPGSTVLIDGRDVEVEGDGDYRAEVEIRRGQKRVEIVAIDAGGNRSTQVKTIGD